MDSKNIIVIQARIGSSRLPGKALLDIEGEPLLVRLIERIRRVQTPARIVVATTLDQQDDRIAELCRKLEITVYRGHSTDLLDRHFQAALHYKANVIAKIPSDCPMIDPSIIDKVFETFFRAGGDYTSNLHPGSYPDGNDVEVMSFNALAVAWRKAVLPMEREHTTPYIWERPNEFRLSNVLWDDEGTLEKGRDCSMTHRWTVDYREDYELVQKVYSELYRVNANFGLNDILSLLEKKPELTHINARYVGVNWYRHHLEELKTISSEQTRII